MKVPMEILYGAAFVAIFAYFAFRAKRTDPRFYGFRLASKGGMVFFIGWLVLAIADNYEKLKLIRTGGYVLAVVGFATMFIGFLKHAKIVFNPGQFDAKREVDPGYDLPYKLCPHCKQIQVRMYHNKMKCQKCGRTIKSE
jgi:hypothetical protein